VEAAKGTGVLDDPNAMRWLIRITLGSAFRRPYAGRIVGTNVFKITEFSSLSTNLKISSLVAMVGVGKTTLCSKSHGDRCAVGEIVDGSGGVAAPEAHAGRLERGSSTGDLREPPSSSGRDGG